ncbi:MAG: magnesium chelatase subunit H [Proteobacteria bacterium]|nr:magnesium chelatase subunit H [Burkholderiales bacterium]
MKLKHTLVAESGARAPDVSIAVAREAATTGSVPIRVVIVTLDSHLASVTENAHHLLRRELPGLALSLHAASEWDDPQALERCRADIAQGDIIVVTMMFMEEQIQAVLPALSARRDQCDAMIVCMSAGEVMKLTRLGRFDMSQPASGPMALLKRLRGSRGSADSDKPGARGAQQMKMLRRLPKILRFIPGTAQDVRAYFVTLQYWLAGSEDNVVNMVRFLIDRYADGPRAKLRGRAKALPPSEYPEVGVYHPRMKGRISDSPSGLPRAGGESGTVGVLIMRSYVLAGNAGHYDGVIAALEARGLRVIPAFSSGLDSRPAIEQFFMADGHATVDAMVSLTGFSLVGGPAYNDAHAAEEILARLDVPYVAAHPVEFQTLEQWAGSERGLMPVENTIMVAIPEIDGATGPMVFGGRSSASGEPCTGCDRHCVFSTTDHVRDMHVCSERADRLAARVQQLVSLRRATRSERKLGIVIFNFPPNAANTGTAAFLSVFESLHHTLRGLRDAGYTVELPASADELRDRIIHGNAARFGADANVHARISVDDHVRRERWLPEIEKTWGPAPGRAQSDGASIFILGERFGNVFIGVQPGFGYEGDPMRLLFERGFAPTHAFSAFYRYLREDFGAHALLHFGTHGALEFMPGKQSGMSANCWPDRLLGDVPDLYLYAANNPSEGTIAKRRAAATLVSYMSPSIAQAGLYRGLIDLKESIDRWRRTEPEPDFAGSPVAARMAAGSPLVEVALTGTGSTRSIQDAHDEAPCASAEQRGALAALIQSQAAELDLAPAAPAWLGGAEAEVLHLSRQVLELEQTLIPHGLHVVGQPLPIEERLDMLSSMAEATHGVAPSRPVLKALVDVLDATLPTTPAARALRIDRAVAAALAQAPDADLETERTIRELAATAELLARDHEIPALLHALDGGFIRPAPGGDVLRTPAVLPTGRNVHGFDPFRMPSVFAVQDGARQAARVLERHIAAGNAFPESIAVVLWGTDNLKSEGAPIGQVLALLGAQPRFDAYGRLAGAQLIPLAELGRARVDVVVTLSGIFRDLLPLQTRLLAEAAYLAAAADEPEHLNFVRKHALAYQRANGCDLETAALRVFSNADGAYGSNVNLLIDNSRWEDEDELAETYTRRKSFAYGRSGRPVAQAALLKSVLADVALTYQNLESVELGVTTQDTYFDTLGGISRAVQRAQGGKSVPVYISDQTRGDGVVRTLSEQVSLEARTRMLNPKWYEGLLQHGYEGVRQIEEHVKNTMGWSATTGQVAPWVYQQITQTFVLDPEMRERLARLNPTASAKVANRLLEAHERRYWEPDAATLDALRRAGDELEDRVEGIGLVAAA